MKYAVELKPRAVKDLRGLPHREVQEVLEDFEDLKALRAAKDAERDEPTVPLAAVKRELGL